MKPFLLALLLGTTILTTPVMAQIHENTAQVQAGDLTLTGAFIRATLPNSPAGGAYVTITNTGSQDDRLISVTAPVGDSVVVHEMTHNNGVMTMRTLPDGLPIPAGETLSLAPSASHMMINGLDERLEEGHTLDLTLTFDVAGDVTVNFDVLALNARSHPEMDHSDMDHSGHGDHMDHGDHIDHADHSADHSGHGDHGTTEFDQASVTGDDARIEGLLKDRFESPDAPLSVAPILIDNDVAIIGWAQVDTGGRALLRRDEHGLWRISLCSGDGLKGAENMMSAGIDHAAAMRLSNAQSTAEAALTRKHTAKFGLFDGMLFIDPDAEHDVKAHGEHGH